MTNECNAKVTIYKVNYTVFVTYSFSRGTYLSEPFGLAGLVTSVRCMHSPVNGKSFVTKAQAIKDDEDEDRKHTQGNESLDHCRNNCHNVTMTNTIQMVPNENTPSKHKINERILTE